MFSALHSTSVISRPLLQLLAYKTRSCPLASQYAENAYTRQSVRRPPLRLVIDGPRKFLAVTDWNKLQYHKQLTNPPWTRLHQDWLTDYRFSQLSLQQRGVLFCMHMLAARSANKIPFDVPWIAKQFGCKSSAVSKVVLNLISTGFLLEFAETQESKGINSLPFVYDVEAAPPEGEQRKNRTEGEQREKHRADKSSIELPDMSPNRRKRDDRDFSELKDRVLKVATQLGTKDPYEIHPTVAQTMTFRQCEVAVKQLIQDRKL